MGARPPQGTSAGIRLSPFVRRRGKFHPIVDRTFPLSEKELG
jgi:hypothetical protein